MTQEPESGAAVRPFVVDLDGTLLNSDLLVETGFAFLRHSPLKFYQLFTWLLKGKGILKEKLAESEHIDVTTLPYNKDVLDLIRDKKKEGREVVLATASHMTLAEKIAEHLDVFDKVVSTIPLPYVPRVMPDLPSEVLNKFNSQKNIAVVCVIAKLSKRLTENFWLNTNDEQMDIPGLVEYSNLRPLDNHIVYVPFYMPGEHTKFAESDEVFLTKVKKYLKKINPDIEESDFLDIRASRYRYAQPICEPSFLDSLPPVSLPIKGLWVADTSYYYPEDRGISESIDFGRNLATEITK